MPQAKASVEMMYEFTAPFVVDDRRIREQFALQATDFNKALERTVNWYKDDFTPH
jgi:hypothetical protein